MQCFQGLRVSESTQRVKRGGAFGNSGSKDLWEDWEMCYKWRRRDRETGEGVLPSGVDS